MALARTEARSPPGAATPPRSRQQCPKAPSHPETEIREKKTIASMLYVLPHPPTLRIVSVDENWRRPAQSPACFPVQKKTRRLPPPPEREAGREPREETPNPNDLFQYPHSKPQS